MSRESAVFVLGIIVFFMPVLGIPDTWRFYLLFISGFILMILGYMLRRAAYLRNIETESGERMTDSFVESQPEDEMLSDTSKTV